MLVLLSPAKWLDFDTPVQTDSHSTPALMKDAGQLMRTARNLTQKKLRDLMDISADLAKLNADRHKQLTTEITPENGRQAVLSFNGQVYAGLDAGTLDEDGLQFAQAHLGILSGLYGYLRPLDLIQPYRLEMGTKLKTRRGQTLYDFWGDRIQGRVVEQLTRLETDTVVNLASNEYFGAVDPAALGARIISPAFLDSKDGGPHKNISFFAKQARGAMSQYLIRERITTISGIAGFTGMGYRFDEADSTPDRPVFKRSN